MPFAVENTSIDGALVVTPQAFKDDRGYFAELYREDYFRSLGLNERFVQVNSSVSVGNVVRGLHFQWDPPMAKLMRVARGRAFLVAVDLRKDSPTLGRWVGISASSDDRRQLWAPASFARGFCALDDNTEIEYLCTGTYNRDGESGIRWNDPDIGVEWPVADPLLSDKDRTAQSLREWLAQPQSDQFSR